MKINYRKYGDYYLPDLTLAEKENKQLNKYGLLRLEYLKNYSGFVKVKGCHIEISNATDNELNQIERLLKESVVV